MSDVQRTIEAVWKIESTRLIAAIARVTRDIGIAEELAQDALVAALERWPEEGIPENPAAWLMTAAKRRAIDSLRREQMLAQKHEEVAVDLEVQQQRLGDAMDHALDQVIDDEGFATNSRIVGNFEAVWSINLLNGAFRVPRR